MRYVSATEAKQRLAALLDAAQREPVMIRRQKRDVAVILSPQEHDRLRALADVLARPKFDRYVTIEDRQQFLRLLGRVAELVPVGYRVQICRDRDDDKFLELAINGEADLIVTGDDDLLALHPFHRIPIVTPPAYLAGV